MFVFFFEFIVMIIHLLRWFARNFFAYIMSSFQIPEVMIAGCLKTKTISGYIGPFTFLYTTFLCLQSYWLQYLLQWSKIMFRYKIENIRKTIMFGSCTKHPQELFFNKAKCCEGTTFLKKASTTGTFMSFFSEIFMNTSQPTRNYWKLTLNMQLPAGLRFRKPLGYYFRLYLLYMFRRFMFDKYDDWV